jgi:hypothetical protein
VDTVLVDGEVMVQNGRCTRVDELDVYREVSAARATLQPGVAAELAASAALEPPVREMWHRLAGLPLPDMTPGAWFS